MRVLIVDPPGYGLALAMRAKHYGHEVKHFVRQVGPKEKHKPVGKNISDLVDDFRPWLRWANLVINTDNTLYVRDLQWHRDAGGIVIGASPDTAQWEIDRNLGQSVLRKAGVPVLPSIEFTDYDSAISHVCKTMGRFVSKPTGETDPNQDKALSYVSNGPADMVYMLERWKKLSKLKTPFVLQEFVKGVEMGVAGWFGPHGWNTGFEENFEFKKLMNNDMGVATGEQGTVLRYTRKSKLAEKVLLPLTNQLKKAHYIGDIDVNCIIDEQGNAWPLEFTTRLGWPAFNIQMSLVEGDPIEWMLCLANGIDSKPFLLDKVAVGVVLSLPDYPYSKATLKEVAGIPIYGIKPGTWRWLMPQEMQMGEGPCEVGGQVCKAPIPMTAGDYVLVMTAHGNTVQEARDLCYRRLDRLKMPNSPMYRTDIGSRLARQLPEIQKHGYASNFLFSTPPDS
jgi:phosphoribosylamine---glycine ligase